MKCLILLLVLLFALLIRLNFGSVTAPFTSYSNITVRVNEAFLYKKFAGPVFIPVPFQVL